MKFYNPRSKIFIPLSVVSIDGIIPLTVLLQTVGFNILIHHFQHTKVSGLIRHTQIEPIRHSNYFFFASGLIHFDTELLYV